MHKNSILLCIFLLLTAIGYGQSSNKKKKAPRFEQQSNTYAPLIREEVEEIAPPKKRKKKKSAYPSYNITREQKIKEFEDRMKANAKAEKKKRKQMRKPQYSDRSYFGHKRKPKMRKRKNRKFCKECGIVH